MPTIKEQLNSILVLTENVSLDMAKMKIVQSDMKNKQVGYDKKQDYLISIVESNDKIGKKGLGEQVGENTDDILKLKTKDEVQKGQVRIIGFLSGAVGTSFVAIIWQWIKSKGGG